MITATMDRCPDIGFDLLVAGDKDGSATKEIAAKTGPGDYIVTAPDRMISYDGTIQAADDGTLKARKIAKTWGLLFAAADANLFLPIVNVAKNSLEGRGDRLDLHTIQDVDDALCNEIDKCDLGHSLLGYGFDTIKQPHIFEISNPGKITNHCRSRLRPQRSPTHARLCWDYRRGS